MVMMMGSNNRDREEALTFITNPSSSSSPITVSDQLDWYLTDPTSLIGSASGSFQSDSLLGLGEPGSTNLDLEFGFSRPDFRQSPLAGTVEFYQRHVFLCYKNPRFWPPRIEASEFDRLPRLLYAAVMARKSDMKKETRLTICEGHDGTETSNGDVLIFPDMIRYRRLTHFDVETFVEEVLVKDGEWLPGSPEPLKGSHIFVCSHGSRDRRCGVCGPVLVNKFREETELLGLQGKVFVSPCSHIGGDEYAGNVIIFGSSINGDVMGHWYGYVTPDDVPVLLQQHIIKGEIWDSLWRGQMGTQKSDAKSQGNSVSCCQQNENFSSCRDSEEKISTSGAMEAEAKLSADNNCSSGSIKRLVSRINGGKGASRRKSMPMWLDGWEPEDTYAALAVVFAAVSVAIAYSCYKQLK
ncbi:uncharacterized protein LOC114728734 [Neltuma alba]|uniref:uncharacterized protein LOC114728734 n=1 Tax=Neltuma alba TaxID=207710 RepID=UPI0010A3272A|nr:uncharacterized protein LOC114728734 [Prosopis alba]